MIIEAIKMPQRELEDQIIRILKGPIKFLKEVNRQEDIKRTKERDIILYPLHELNDITYHGELTTQLRYAVTHTYQLVLAEEGKPSKYIPQHREMTKNKYCIAAGNFYLSDEIPKKIIKITHDSGDYHPSMATLLWPLTILALYPELIHRDFTIQIGGDNESKLQETFHMNAEALHVFLDNIWTHPQIDSSHSNLRQRIAEVDAQATRDSITHTEYSIISTKFSKARDDFARMQYPGPPQLSTFKSEIFLNALGSTPHSFFEILKENPNAIGQISSMSIFKPFSELKENGSQSPLSSKRKYDSSSIMTTSNSLDDSDGDNEEIIKVKRIEESDVEYSINPSNFRYDTPSF